MSVVEPMNEAHRERAMALLYRVEKAIESERSTMAFPAERFYEPLGSLKDVSKINTTEAAHRHYGECVMELEGLGFKLNRAFTRLEEATGQMLASGVRAEPIMPAHVEAAFTTWKADKVTEAPLGAPIA